MTVSMSVSGEWVLFWKKKKNSFYVYYTKLDAARAWQKFS